ncbi:unnamed protein product, partial [Closterium sp. NIES-64]
SHPSSLPSLRSPSLGSPKPRQSPLAMRRLRSYFSLGSGERNAPLHVQETVRGLSARLGCAVAVVGVNDLDRLPSVPLSLSHPTCLAISPCASHPRLPTIQLSVQKTVRGLSAMLGCAVAVVDVNDLMKVKILAASAGVDHGRLTTALLPNPAGNADQQTPIVIVRGCSKP